MMTWVIIGLVAAVLISNFFKLMPRGRERHLYHLREQARQAGFAVEWLRESQRVNQLAGCITYRMPLQRCPVAQEFSCRRSDEGWIWLNGTASTPYCLAVLEKLPPSVQGVERQSLSAIVYWQEPDDPARLEQLVEALRPLKDTA